LHYFCAIALGDKVSERLVSGKFALVYSEQPFERDDAAGKCSTPFHEAAAQNRAHFESVRPNPSMNL
jgi:hypothetical protein